MSGTRADNQLDRSQGCLLGQLAGDALGSLVEFQSPQQIRQTYPKGLREIAAGGTWNTIAGQPTDDSEMALMLARMLVERGEYDQAAARRAYIFWLDSDPFDCGHTVRGSLRGAPNPDSQANGAMMRASPLGLFGVRQALEQVAAWAREDAAITHVHPVCQQANALFVMAIALAVRDGCAAEALYAHIVGWARDMDVEPALLDATVRAAEAPPADFLRLQGWVLVAWQNALWQLLHAESLEAALVDTVLRGGDTDTNAAIAGALLGAVYGRSAVPQQWQRALLGCRPEAGKPGVFRPRPACFWPVDALQLARRLLGVELVQQP